MQRPSVFPTREPVTLEDVRQQCRIPLDDTSENTRLQGYIAAARAMAEQETGRRLITQTWQLVLDAWPSDGAIELQQTPVQDVTSIVYTNTAGASVTVSGALYRLDVRGARAVIRPAYGQEWPSDLRSDDVGGITITYVVGYGDEPLDVPEGIREWILAHVNAMWENRGALTGANMQPLPYLGRLLDEWRVYS